MEPINLGDLNKCKLNEQGNCNCIRNDLNFIKHTLRDLKTHLDSEHEIYIAYWQQVNTIQKLKKQLEKYERTENTTVSRKKPQQHKLASKDACRGNKKAKRASNRKF